MPTEQVLEVLPLAVPTLQQSASLGELEEVASVAVFCERARLVRLDFSLNTQNASAVVGICQQLDGLPLALELAALRLRAISPQELLGRLNSRLSVLTAGPHDWPTHQQTLRATIEWSYELLSPYEKRLLGQLATGQASWKFEEIQAVCDPTSDQPSQSLLTAGVLARRPLLKTPDLAQILSSLLNKHMVRMEVTTDGEFRFGMLHTIREYSLEQTVLKGQEP